jgi:hypothetical protein
MDKKMKKILLLGAVVGGGFLLYNKFGPGASGSIDPAQLATLQTWANGSTSAGLKAMVAAQVPAEINFLYRIVTQNFDTNTGLTAADQAVWQALATKYNFG